MQVGSVFDETNQPINDAGEVVTNGQAAQRTLYLDKVKVGDAAQTTASLGFTLMPVKDFKFDAAYRYVNQLYANLNISDFSTQGKSALELPSYGLFEVGACL
ncbi:hypothetical protein [Halpernia sp. GG3]